MKRRGPRRLASITYGKLAEWTGMAEGSIRNAVHQGRIETSNIDSLIRWVNTRREAKGLPLIGDPITATPDSQPIVTNEPNDAQPVPSQDMSKLSTPLEAVQADHTPLCKCSECYAAAKARREPGDA